MITRLFIFFCLLTLPVSLFAQENNVRDSLIAQLKTLPDHNEERLSVMLELARATRGNLEECQKYAGACWRKPNYRATVNISARLISRC